MKLILLLFTFFTGIDNIIYFYFIIMGNIEYNHQLFMMLSLACQIYRLNFIICIVLSYLYIKIIKTIFSDKQLVIIMCHKTCLTCVTGSDSFTSCTSCISGMSLSNSMCICNKVWDSSCTENPQLRETIQFIISFLTLMEVGLIILYTVRTRLSYSYRLLALLQNLSLFLYCPMVYLSYENQLILETFHKSMGPYVISNRLIQLTPGYLIPTIIGIVLGIFALISWYHPCKVFVQKYIHYGQYLMRNWIYFLHTIYLFTGRLMVVIITMYIQTKSINFYFLPASAIYFIIFVAVIITLAYQFHYGDLDRSIYSGPVYIYTLLSIVPVLGVTLVQTQYMLILIFGLPLPLLLVVSLVNRQQKIFSIKNLLLWLVEIFSVGVIIAFILVDNKYKTYILVSLGFLVPILVLTEAIVLYYFGWYLFDRRKVYPQGQQQNTQQELNPTEGKSDYKIDKKQSLKYF